MRRLLSAILMIAAACQPASDLGNSAQNLVDADANVLPGTARDEPGPPPANPDATVSSDDPQPAPQARSKDDCPIVRSSEWHAHVDAMPGDNDNPRLIVSGRVTVPTGGYRLALRLGPVAESYPVQVTVHLDAVPPSGPVTQALETREVRGSWRSEPRVGSVTVRCGSEVIARLSNIGTAL